MLIESVPVGVRAQLRCPPWCVGEGGHHQTDAEILTQGGLNVHHLGVEHVAIARTAIDGKRVTVQLRHFLGYEFNGRLDDERPTVHVTGLPDCGLSLQESAQLVATITTALVDLHATEVKT